MKERFLGDGNAHLIGALRRQILVQNDTELATELTVVGDVVEFGPRENLIVQDASDNEIFLLLVGKVGIIINGAQVATRSAGEHVGEMAAVEPSLPRSATVTALETVVAVRLSSSNFLTLAEKYPGIWQPIAQELCKRLRYRNNSIFPPNEAPKLFIMSSSEALLIAHALRAGLEKDVFSTVWDDGVFFAGGYPLEALEKQVGQSDFAIAIAEPDDISESRGHRAPTVRDNVLFELGLFMGRLTRYRTILVHPRIKELKLPSDLQGLTLIPYDTGDEATVVSRIAPVCDKVREVVKSLGVRTFTIERTE